MGFPCNQFGAQEPGTNAEILEFASSKFGVTFPMFAKIEVNGPNAAPLYEYLRSAAPNPDGTTNITWNFTKFLVDRDGQVVGRFGSIDKPESLKKKIEALL